MGEYTQENRLIQIMTPLGEDVLLLQGFNGYEGVSKLFQFDLRMHSKNRSIAFDSIVGKKATIKIILDDGNERFINGIISAFSQGGSSTNFAHYHATLVPWLWMLTRTSDCRIFQNLTVPDIIQKIFKEYGFSDFKNKLYGSFEERDYCVQYRETDFNFVSRLMEEEGIFYFFDHEESKHTLVLANRSSEFKPSPLKPSAIYDSAEGAGRTDDVVSEWSIVQEVRPGKYEIKDYNFEMPSLNLAASISGKDGYKYEIYDYPGEYRSLDEGERLVNIRMQEEETPLIVITGSGTCRGFASGYRFSLKEHYRGDLNKEYVLTTVQHTAEQGDNYQSSEADALNDFEYANNFQCIPYSNPFRPARVTPVPVVHGTQTAKVVGPAGEEIYTDKYGRVKVQFHWDREGKKNEKSSCWIRVSHPWAGGNWGAISIPRIGQEVVVDFLEGDPDQPIIVGRVYNAEQMPPWGLPGGKVVSGIKSNSTKGGGGYNEMSFNDTKGTELITIHGQYDMDTTIEHDERVKVGNDRTESVGHNEMITIGNDRTESVGGNESISVAKNRTHLVSENENKTVTLMRTHTVGINEAITVGAAQEVTVGTMRIVTVGINQDVNIGSDLSESIGSNRTEEIGSNHEVTVEENSSTTVGKNKLLKVGKEITIDAGDQVLIQTGKASILMKKDGTINIQGKDITIKGSGTIVGKASGDIVLKGTKILEN
ncbi:MAG: type secretion system secreted protein VgrG [Blastocatellia bacterium]